MKTRARPSRAEITAIMLAVAILAVRIGPRFAEADTEEQICRLVDSLHTIRANLDCYRATNQGRLPPIDSSQVFERALVSVSRFCGSPMDRIPANPFNNRRSVRFDGEPAGSNLAGWRLNTATGLLQADNCPECSAL
jgi:hypothetical protein